MGLRYYTRLRITKSFGLDDWVIGISLVPTFALTCVVLVADNNFSWNRHSWDLHSSKGPPGYKLCLAAQILFFWAATLNKMSLLAFYKRLTGPVTSLWYRWCIVLGLAFHKAMLLAYFIVAVSGCKPLSAFWTSLATYYSHTCINVGVYMLSFSIITIFLDPLLLLMPIPIVWTLQLSLKQRIAVLTLFAIGFIVCIAGIVQAVYVNEALVKSYDETWVGWPLWITTAIEVDLEILCVSIPAIRPLLAIYLPQLLESQRPLTRELKEVYDSNELSDASPHPANLHILEKEIPGYSSNVHEPTARDLERGQILGTMMRIKSRWEFIERKNARLLLPP